MRPAIRNVLFDVAPSLIAYYGLRALGASEYVALLAGTVLAGVKVGYDAIRARRLDPFAGYLMLNFGLSLAVGLATSDARLLLAGNALVNGLGGLLFIGSCFIGRPLTQVVSERAETDDPSDASPEAQAYRHRVHVLLSAMWGVGLLIGTALHLVVIFSMSVDVANGVTTVLSLVTMGLLIVATIIIGSRSRKRWEQRSVPQG